MSRYGSLVLGAMLASCAVGEVPEQARLSPELYAYEQCREHAAANYPDASEFRGPVEDWPDVPVCVIPDQAALYYQPENVKRREAIARGEQQ